MELGLHLLPSPADHSRRGSRRPSRRPPPASTKTRRRGSATATISPMVTDSAFGIIDSAASFSSSADAASESAGSSVDRSGDRSAGYPSAVASTSDRVVCPFSAPTLRRAVTSTAAAGEARRPHGSSESGDPRMQGQQYPVGRARAAGRRREPRLACSRASISRGVSWEKSRPTCRSGRRSALDRRPAVLVPGGGAGCLDPLPIQTIPTGETLASLAHEDLLVRLDALSGQEFPTAVANGTAAARSGRARRSGRPRFRVARAARRPSGCRRGADSPRPGR